MVCRPQLQYLHSKIRKQTRNPSSHYLVFFKGTVSVISFKEVYPKFPFNLKDTLVNRVLPSLHDGSHEITLTVLQLYLKWREKEISTISISNNIVLFLGWGINLETWLEFDFFNKIKINISLGIQLCTEFSLFHSNKFEPS